MTYRLFKYKKVGFHSLIWKNIEKRTQTFINHIYLHPLKNILRYMYFFPKYLFPKMTLLYVNNTN